jgi:hypothetical protein
MVGIGSLLALRHPGMSAIALTLEARALASLEGWDEQHPSRRVEGDAHLKMTIASFFRQRIAQRNVRRVRALHADDVIAGIDVMHLAGDAAR